jgi:DNA helicase HerA-like ATPase
LAEGFSDQGVPVFCADVKGDLSGVAEEGEMKLWIEARDKAIGFTQDFKAYPVIFWDLFGDRGHPIRATISIPCRVSSAIASSMLCVPSARWSRKR